MIYAQILDNVIQNIIEIDDICQLPQFSVGFDALVRVDGLNPIPGIGWYYNPFVAPPGSPLTSYPLLATYYIEFGNQMLLEFTTSNLQLDSDDAGQTENIISYCASLIQCWQIGALSQSIVELNIMIADTSSTKTDLSPFITNDILYAWLNQIQNYIGVDLTPNPGP